MTASCYMRDFVPLLLDVHNLGIHVVYRAYRGRGVQYLVYLDSGNSFLVLVSNQPEHRNEDLPTLERLGPGHALLVVCITPNDQIANA